jgi:hypothetical protein
MRAEYVDSIKYTFDALSVATVVGALTDMLPEIGALFTIIWTGIRIYETYTVQKLLGRVPKEDNDAK